MNKKKYLVENINDACINTRRELLQIIYNNSSKIIKEKGNGVQIKFSDMSDSIINTLYNILYKQMQENRLDIDF